jgi:RNA-directed DNA polymerase
MKEPYDEGLASHTGPESCGGDSNGTAEALTGVRTGRVLSREILSFQGADGMGQSEGNTWRVAIARQVRTLRGRRPWHVRKHTAREPGDPRAALGRGTAGCIGKSEDVIQ